MANIWDKLEQQAFTPSKKEELSAGSVWDSLEAQAFGLKDPNKNSPGFISDVKRGGGQIISSIGSTLQDLGPTETGKAIEAYGNKVTRRNPSQINTVEEALSNPLTTAREALGEVTPQVGASLAAGIVGRGIGGAIGVFGGPVGIAAGQAIGGAGAAYLMNLAQSYGGIRAEQRESGDNDIKRAIGAGGASALLDTAFGAERITSKVLGKGTSILAREGGTSLVKNIAKQGAIGLAEEAGTEVAQTGLERYGAFKDLTGAEAYNEYGLSAIKGGIGGGVIRGGLAGVAGERRPDNSLLGGSTETNKNATTPDANAIQSAINVNPGAGLDTQSLVNQTVGVVDRQKKEQEALTKQRQADMVAAMNEPTGKKITDANGIERDETAYDVAQRQAGQSSQQIADANAQANQQAAQQQTAEQQAQLEASRKLILDKFGTTPIMNDAGVQIGVKFNGASYFKGMTKQLNEAVDKVIAEEANKPELTHHVEFAWLDAYKDKKKEGEVVTPKSLSSKVANYLTGATSIEDVLDRVKAEIKDLNAKPKKSQAALDQLTFLESFKTNLIGEANGTENKQQVPSGVGNVPVEGRTTETGTGDLGLLQSTSVRPVGTGSNNGIENGQQNVGGGETVPRNNAGGAVTSTNAVGQETGQVNGQEPNSTENQAGGATGAETSTRPSNDLSEVRRRVDEKNSTFAGRLWQNETGREYANEPQELKEKWEAAIEKDNVTLRLIKELLFDSDFKPNVGRMLSDRIITKSNKMDEDAEDKIKRLFAYFIGTPFDEQLKEGDLAAHYGISTNTVSNWKKKAKETIDEKGNFLEGWSKASKELLPEAIAEIKQKLDIKTNDQFLTMLRQSVEKVKNELDENAQAIKDATQQSVVELEKTDEAGSVTGAGMTSTGRVTGGSTNEGLKADKASAKGIAAVTKLASLTKRLDIAIKKGDTKTIDSLQNQIKKVQDDLALAEQAAKIAQRKANAVIASSVAASKQEAGETTTPTETETETKPKSRVRQTGKVIPKTSLVKKEEPKAEPKKEEPKKEEPKASEVVAKSPEEALKEWDALVPKPPIEAKDLSPTAVADWTFAENRNFTTVERIVAEEQARIEKEKAKAEAEEKLKTNKENIQFSKTKEKTGATVAQVKKELKEFIGLKNNSKVVKIVQSISDLPAKLQQAMAQQTGENNKVAGFALDSGVAYLIADNLNPNNIRGTFMHEVGSHLGLESMLTTKEFDVLWNKVMKWGSLNDGSLENRIAKRAMARIENANPTNDQRDIELIAYFLEEALREGVNPSMVAYRTQLERWISDLIRALRSVMKKIGLNGEGLTAQDIVDLAYGAAHLAIVDNKPVPSDISPEFRFSIAQPISAIRKGAQQRINSLPTQYQGPLNVIFDTVQDLAKKGKIWASFTEDLANVAKEYIPSVTKYVSLMKERSAIKTKYERRVEEILQDYQKLSGEVKGTGKGSVNAFLKESTMSGKWGFQPDWIKDPVVVDDIMKSKFDDMPESAQKVIKKVFEHGFNTLSDMKQAVTTNITTEFDALIAQAEADEDAKEVSKLQKQKADALRDYRSLMAVQANSPYAPLKRFGSYVVAGKSQEYLDAEKANDRKTIEKLQKDGDHYFVQFAETWAEAKAIARTQEDNYALVEPFQKDDAQRAMYGGKDVSDVFQRLRTLADNSFEEGSTKSKKAIDSLLVNLQLALLSDQSARQAENRRKGIAGAEDDMMRSFATQGRATAHFISTLHNTSAIYDELRNMQKQADASTPGRGERRRYYNEFLKRHSMGFNYEANPLLDKALGVTSMWMLLTNPAYYLQNATQPYMMSLPVIAAKHGYGKSSAAMIQGYKDIASVIRSDGLNEKTYSQLPADVREAVEALVNSGRIDISLESDLGRWQSTEEKNVASLAIEKLRGISQDIESINRVVTAVAAYRLEKQAGASQEKAIAYADQIILDTHGDYSGFNAPRFTRQGIGRLMTQFRKFQLIQISLMAKLVNQAFKGASPEERFIGKKALAYTLGHTFAAAGVMGMPGFAAIAWILGAAFGDEDEPDNPEATLRKMIGDDTIANLLLKGVPKLAGVDLSGKLGMGQMLSILPYANVDLTKDGYARAVTASMGPFIGGLMPKAVDGVGLITQGNYYKGLEALAPAGIANVLKATELANKGIVQRNGDVVLSPDDVGVLDVMSQALGLPTNTITDKQFIRNAEYQFEKFYKERTTELKTDYVSAFRNGDTDTMAEIRQKWEETQIARVRNGQKRQPISELFMAPQQQVKREKAIKGGKFAGSGASGMFEVGGKSGITER